MVTEHFTQAFTDDQAFSKRKTHHEYLTGGFAPAKALRPKESGELIEQSSLIGTLRCLVQRSRRLHCREVGAIRNRFYMLSNSSYAIAENKLDHTKGRGERCQIKGYHNSL